MKKFDIVTIRKVKTIGSPLGATSFLYMGYTHVNSTRKKFLPVKQVSNPIQGTVGCLINYLATVAPMGTYCMAGYYYCMQYLLLGKTTKAFPIPGACILLLALRLASKEMFLVSSRQIVPPHPTVRISLAIESYYLVIIGK